MVTNSGIKFIDTGERQTYTPAEFAALLGVARTTIYKLMREGNCPVEPLRIGSKPVFPRASVHRLLRIEPEQDLSGEALHED